MTAALSQVKLCYADDGSEVKDQKILKLCEEGLPTLVSGKAHLKVRPRPQA